MVKPLRHRQTKGAATDMFYLTPPRHISTLPWLRENSGVQSAVRNFRLDFVNLKNQKCLRPLLGEDDRENNSAHSRLGLVFTQPGSKGEILAHGTALSRAARPS